MKFKLPKTERLSPNYSRKISEVLLEFVKEIVPLDSTPRALENAIILATAIWNMGLLPEDDQGAEMMNVREALHTRGNPLMETELNRLLEFRKTRYGHDRRMVADYHFEPRPTGPYLSVASVDMDRPENRAKAVPR